MTVGVKVGVGVAVGVIVAVAVGVLVCVGVGVAVEVVEAYSEMGGVKLAVHRATPLLKRNSSIQPSSEPHPLTEAPRLRIVVVLVMGSASTTVLPNWWR